MKLRINDAWKSIEINRGYMWPQIQGAEKKGPSDT